MSSVVSLTLNFLALAPPPRFVHPRFTHITTAPRRVTPPTLLFGDLEGRVSRWWDRRRERAHWRRDRPERIILIRHGESLGNTDRVYFSTEPDSQQELSNRGYSQAVVAGLKLRRLVGNETCRFFTSPYMRTRQTLLAVLKAFEGRTVQVTSEPRLREQDFGNFQDPSSMEAVFAERQAFGRFYFRFPDGEAGTDVFDRVAAFITYLFRTMGRTGYFEDGDDPRSAPAQNYVLVTHGLLMRIFCMCYFGWTVREFEQIWNPSNGEIWVLQKVEGMGTYELQGRYKASRTTEGRFIDVKYGVDRSQRMPAHMKRPLPSRLVSPGAAGALDGEELGHLRGLPGPRRWNAQARGDWSSWNAKNAEGW